MRVSILVFLGVLTVSFIVFKIASQSLRRYEDRELERLKKNLYQ